MYDGDTSIKENFVGYGAGVIGPAPSIINAQSDAGANVTTSLSLFGSASSGGGVGEFDYTEVDGIHFVCIAATSGPVGGTYETNAASSTATATAIVGGDVYTSTSSIDSFELFTYPD
jgi:hypothetical protein